MPEHFKKDQLENLLPGKYCFYCLHPNPRKIITREQILYNCLQCGRTDGRIIRISPNIKLVWHNDERQHFTVGVILKNKKTGNYLLMKKRTFPLVIDVIAGHIRENETPAETLLRETKEETGFTLTRYKQIWEGLVENEYCRRGAPHHYWYLFVATYEGKPRSDLQEVNYFKEYTWEEVINEKMLNPSIKNVLGGLNTFLLEP